MSLIVLPFVALAFACWAVSLGGIASLQADCDDNTTALELADVNGFSSYQTCSTIYRYYWFIIALEFVVILKFLVLFALQLLPKSRIALVGLTSIATLLYIQLSDSFLTAGSLPVFYDGAPSNRLKTMIAGGIMTATANCFLIIATGYNDAFEEVKEKIELEVAEKAAV